MSKFLLFDEALPVAQSLRLASVFEWRQWCKEGMCPPNVPSNPHRTYKDGGWQGWGHWLGTGNQRTTPFLPFGEALAVARSLNLAGAREWKAWCKEGRRPPNVPAHPEKIYKDGGWQGWAHWLGTGNSLRSGSIKKASNFALFAQALTFARSLSLANQTAWKVWCKEGTRPPNVPADPSRAYKGGGWQGWGHWLGTGNQRTRSFLPFGEALAVARSLNLANLREWYVWCKEGRRPPNVPSNPHRTYKDGEWQGWGHWLGTGNQHTKQFLPFGEALAVARSLNLANRFEWQQWCKEGRRPPNVPAYPEKIYKDGGWQGWVHWLGPGNSLRSGSIKKASKFALFAQALTFARSLSLANQKAWKVWCKEGTRPPNVPADPSRAYEDGGWQGWGHWLGTGDARNTTLFLPFDEAPAVAQSPDLDSQREWEVWRKEGTRPPNVPSRPDRTYEGGGWQGRGHWLGTGSQSSTTKTNQFLPLGEALAVARSLNLPGRMEWRVWPKEGMCPPNVPSDPSEACKDSGWQGHGHWLGNGNQSSQAKGEQFLPFDEALRLARALRLVSSTEWQLWCRSGARPANVPANPHQVYVHDGWGGWEHWLYHANLDAAPAPASARPDGKRAAADRAGSPGKGGGKRRRR